MVDISSLNPQQYEAASNIEGPLMILAGAGTGKTRVITYRIAHMIDRGVDASNIVALTFTNKAAREMKERVKQLVSSKLANFKIGTFHSFCLYLIRRFPEAAGVHPNFGLVGSSDQTDFVRRSLEEKNWQGLYRPEDLLARISRAKNALLKPDTIAEDLNFCQQETDSELLARVYELYERQLNLHRVIDFDDCILKAVELLKNNPDILEKVQSEHTHYLVDEFQDTNFAQLRALEILAGKTHNICAVGDDDQSIYSWRGALVETIDRFLEIFPATKLIKLEQNYRCTNVILNAANAVIRNNPNRKDKTLWSDAQSEQPISLCSKEDDVAEARWIAGKCFALLGQGLKLRDIGILYRANAQARNIELALREHRLHYKVYGGSSFFERKEVKDFLAYFKLSLNPKDRLSFWRIINTPARGIGLKTLEKIEAVARKKDLSPFEILSQQLVELPANTKAKVDEFIQTLKDHSQFPLIHIDELEEHGEKIIKSFGLANDIKHKVTHEGARKRKLESLARLPKWLKQLAESQVEEKGELNLIELVDALMLGDDGSQNQQSSLDNHISLMTIHAAKGLEFPAVFVCGLEDELLPHKNSIELANGIEEERRLFYVAITRAKEKLHLSYARERYSNFQKQTRKPSRFLKELPEAEVLIENKQTQSGLEKKFATEEDRKQKNKMAFAKISENLKKGFR